jgi:hypothetical protein
MASSNDRFVELAREILQAKALERKTDWIVTIKSEEPKASGKKRLTVTLEVSGQRPRW